MAKYKWAILVQIQASVSNLMRVEIRQASDVGALYKNLMFIENYRKSFSSSKLRLHQIINKVESQAFSLEYRFAAGFIGGSCKLCPECVTISNSREPCRHSFNARPSIETGGIDVFETAKNAGLPFNIPPKNNTVWNGLVLIT